MRAKVDWSHTHHLCHPYFQPSTNPLKRENHWRVSLVIGVDFWDCVCLVSRQHFFSHQYLWGYKGLWQGKGRPFFGSYALSVKHTRGPPSSLRKQPMFREVATWALAKQRLSNEQRNSIPMTWATWFLIVLLLGCATREFSFNQSEALPRSG